MRGTTPGGRARARCRRHFYPRAPRGARHLVKGDFRSRRIFLSTCPARGTTGRFRGVIPGWVGNFYPRAPRGARLFKSIYCGIINYISIHVPREGHDPSAKMLMKMLMKFLSTCPARGTTALHVDVPALKNGFLSTCPARGTTHAARQRRQCQAISIHVPREGHDTSRSRASRRSSTHFYPRAPRGARLPRTQQFPPNWKFLSTCPARGTTYKPLAIYINNGTSIHVPREGHDVALAFLLAFWMYFYPRAPRGARHVAQKNQGFGELFLSTCPARGTTWFSRAYSGLMRYFYPRAL